MTDREPFNPGDSMDAMSEMFRVQVIRLAIEAQKVALYRDLTPQQQLQAFLAGALTGVIGTALCHVDTASADAMMEAIVGCLPDCREMAESIVDVDGKPVLNHHDQRE